MTGRHGGLGLRVVVAVSALIAVAGLASTPADARAQRVPTPSTTKIQLTQDVAYGRSPDQRLDVYWTKEVVHAPVILMVHGGGWYRGDKAASGVVTNKVDHWVPEGYVFVSTNYRLVPHVDPIQEAQDVGRALAYVQRHVERWGGDPQQIVLMGHSAGAHLVSLLAAEPELAYDEGARPWLGTVALDSAPPRPPCRSRVRRLPCCSCAPPAGRTPVHRLTGSRHAPKPREPWCGSSRLTCGMARSTHSSDCPRATRGWSVSSSTRACRHSRLLRRPRAVVPAGSTSHW